MFAMKQLRFVVGETLGFARKLQRVDNRWREFLGRGTATNRTSKSDLHPPLEHRYAKNLKQFTLAFRIR